MPYTAPTIDEYLHKRLMPVEGAIPHLPGIEMYGDSIPAKTVGGDLFEYINFQQRYDIDARIQRALKLSKEFLEPRRPGEPSCTSVDDHVDWLRSKTCYRSNLETEYRGARSSEQTRIAENLQELYNTAGVLLVDAEGHGIISAKIGSTVHDTFHAFMLAELDRWGKTTPELFERINLRLAQSATARNALGRSEEEYSREVAPPCCTVKWILLAIFGSLISGIPRRCCSAQNLANFWTSIRAGWCSSCPSDWKFRKSIRIEAVIFLCITVNGERIPPMSQTSL